MLYKLDTETQIFFYEQEFYCLSNFSAFCLFWENLRFDTLEAAYHWEKFSNYPIIQDSILNSHSAHDAFKLAQEFKSLRDPNWDKIKIQKMKSLLLAKVIQHPYVKKKLLETGTRELIEDSWRDNFWGWGKDKNGQNQLGKLWMEIREIFKNVN